MKICSFNSNTHDATLAQAIAWLSSHKKHDSALDYFKISEMESYRTRIYLIAIRTLKQHIKHTNIPNIT